MSVRMILAAAGAAGMIAAATPALSADPCADPGAPAANIELVKKFYVAFNTHQNALLDEVLAKDWVDVPLAPGQGPGAEGMKAVVDQFYKSFPDFKAVNDDFIASGDKVAVRSTITATHRGDFATVKATGKPVKLMAIDIHQICQGRVVQTWHLEDWLSALFQIGALPAKN